MLNRTGGSVGILTFNSLYAVSANGSDLLLQVRYSKSNNLKKGDEVILISYNKAEHFYDVEPLKVLLDELEEDTKHSKTNPKNKALSQQSQRE